MPESKKYKTMAEITKDYEPYIKGKELNNNGSVLFNKIIKKSSKPKIKKQRASK
jgi:hypothetical protein